MTSQRWTQSGWGIHASSAREVFDLIRGIALLQRTRTYAWRGQTNARWALSSSLYRNLESKGITVSEDAMREREKQILSAAREYGLDRDLGPSATDMHMLALLQHHGVPTRFIDVTSNPLTALWFACQRTTTGRQGRDGAGVLFAIDVTKTPHHASFSHGENPYDAVGSFSYAYNAALEASQGTPFRVFPALPDARMSAQEGYFIVSSVPATEQPHFRGMRLRGDPPGSAALAALARATRRRGQPPEMAACAIVIPAKVKKSLLGPLKYTFNRRRRVLYPDIDGFRESLSTR